MSRTTRWAVVVFVCLAPMAGFAWAFPEWTAEAGLDVWSVPELHAEVARDQSHSDELDSRLQSSVQRLNAKGEIAEELIAGRVGLRGAARSFRKLNASAPVLVVAMRYKHPDCVGDEIHVRNVLDTVKWQLERRPGAKLVMARLYAELKLMKDESGGEVWLGE